MPFPLAVLTILGAALLAFANGANDVSNGVAIVGAGIRPDTAAVHWARVGGLVSAWIITVPVAAGLGAVAGWLLGAG